MNEIAITEPLRSGREILLPSTKILPQHLDKLALVYVRQSSQKQVDQNIESTQLQYRLADRAQAYGWPEKRIDIIDDDLGVSGKNIEGRNGFQRLLAEVSLGHVGIVMGIEMSRLARSCRDWHHLLELCSMFSTLLADADGVYDPHDNNDRLLLGLKGTMSEAELYVLRSRLRSGQLNKARRGELFTHAPIGYVRSDKTLIKDPDDQVRSVVDLVFKKFQELQSASGVLRYFFDNQIQIGCRDHRGIHKGQLHWRAANQSTITGILHHPVYAGAYVYGRRETNPAKVVPGQPGKGRRWSNLDDWEVLIQDHLPAYITWEQWEKNQEKLKENSTRFGQHGAARGGSLLASRVRCGRCGCRMAICYAGTSRARFTCDALRNHLHQTQCQSFNAKPLHDLIERQVIIALSPASLALSVEAARRLEADQTTAEKHHKQTIERATYQSDLARRRYEEVDPGNRLVAAELERRWETALCEQRQAEEMLRRWRQDSSNRLTESQISQIESLAHNIPSLWNNPASSLIDKQKIVRELVEEMSVEVVDNSEHVRVTIHWTGGYQSHHQITRAVGKFDQLEFADQIKQRILQLKRRGHTHQWVAEDLNASGYQSAQTGQFTQAIVSSLCRLFEAEGESCIAIGGYDDCWTTKLLSERLSVAVSALRNWHKRGWLYSIQSDERRVVWADKNELNRLLRLAEHQQGPQCRNTPASLTTPGKPESTI